MNIHPIYGEYKANVFYNLVNHNNVHGVQCYENYKIMFHNSSDKPYTVRSPKCTDYKPFRNRLILSCEKIKRHGDICHIMLASAFPNNIPAEKCTVDHINNNHKDNRLENLQWMSWSENSRKGQAYAVQKSNENGGRNGRPILLIDEDENHKEFKSVECAAKYLIELKGTNTQVKTIASKITRALKHTSQRVYGHKVQDLTKDNQEDEIWKPYDDYLVSSKGRVIGKYKQMLHPQPLRSGSKYTTVFVNGKRHYIHHLVYIAFNGPIPDNMHILHDDTVPLTPNGLYRNYLEDLRIGTRNENMQEWHGNRMKNVV